nr:reverse transcriptase domain-containing protein [Tanacetum cinerariifolium]
MFNSTLIGSARVWFDDLPPESVDSYDDLKKAFLANFLLQKKCIKDTVGIHHIKQREWDSAEDFVQIFQTESRHVKGSPECMRISGFMHGIINPELNKRLHDNILKSVNEIMREILALEKCKFKTPPPMTTSIGKRNNNKLCEFHGEVRYNTVECMHMRRQIKELIKAGKMSYVIKELKQGNRKDQPKAAKKGETSKKDKPQEILMAPSGSKEPDGSSYHTPHWFQWRNCMANRKNIAASKNRGCEAFNLYMDEFCGGKITISVQWDHRKASADNPTLVHNGLRTRSTTFLHHPRCRRKDQISNSSEIPKDMKGVLRHLAEHRLNVREGCLPVRQKKGSQAPKRKKEIQEEVAKLVDARIVKEVHYNNWLSIPVMLKKHDDSWRMCMDFKYLNKACLKDGYPLLEIYWKVESLCGYLFKCFLNAYKGYHQIKIVKEDEGKTTFITSLGILCYSKMPFGLKNAGATYQRLVDKAFQKQIAWVMKEGCASGSFVLSSSPKDGNKIFRVGEKLCVILSLTFIEFGVCDSVHESGDSHALWGSFDMPTLSLEYLHEIFCRVPLSLLDVEVKVADASLLNTPSSILPLSTSLCLGDSDLSRLILEKTPVPLGLSDMLRERPHLRPLQCSPFTFGVLDSKCCDIS